MNYRHVLKRMSIDRLPGEDFEDFMDRADLQIYREMNTVGHEMLLDVDEHTSYIFDNDISDDYIKSVVGEIYELPTVIDVEVFTLLVYHDTVKQMDEYYKVTDVELDEAKRFIEERITQMKSNLDHIKRLKEIENA